MNKGEVVIEPADASAPGLSTTAGSIFKIIRDLGPLFPADIVRRTGLAKSTVSVYVERLAAAGLIREELRPGGKRRMLKVAESAGYSCLRGNGSSWWRWPSMALP